MEELEDEEERGGTAEQNGRKCRKNRVMEETSGGCERGGEAQQLRSHYLW